MYARRVIDKHLDLYGMCLGVQRSEADWAEKREQYIGKPRFPPKPVVEDDCNEGNMQLRVLAWRSAAWQKHQKDLNAICATIMTIAMTDRRIMPVKVYPESRNAFNHCKGHSAYRDSCVVDRLHQLPESRKRLWYHCLSRAKKQCVLSFMNGLGAPGCFESLKHVDQDKCFALLANVGAGMVYPLKGLLLFRPQNGKGTL